jgi:hypothetical protein
MTFIYGSPWWKCNPPSESKPEFSYVDGKYYTKQESYNCKKLNVDGKCEYYVENIEIGFFESILNLFKSSNLKHNE